MGHPKLINAKISAFVLFYTICYDSTFKSTSIVMML